MNPNEVNIGQSDRCPSCGIELASPGYCYLCFTKIQNAPRQVERTIWLILTPIFVFLGVVMGVIIGAIVGIYLFIMAIANAFENICKSMGS